MSFSSFIARRLFRSKHGRHRPGLNPIIRISIIGVALCSSIMLLSVAVTLGFKQQTAEYIRSTTGDLAISPLDRSILFWGTGEKLLDELRFIPGIVEANPIIISTAILKTDSAFAGLPVMGIDSSYSMGNLNSLILSGTPPPWDKQRLSQNPVMLTREIAEQLDLQVGDPVKIYSTNEGNIRLRKLSVAAIYEGTGKTSPAVVPIELLRRMLSRQTDEVTNIRIMTERIPSEQMQERVLERLSKSDAIPQGPALGVSCAEDLNPQMFAWLEMIDSNVYILLILIALVAGFTMIAGLTILVLDKTSLIGILKALGATDRGLRAVFIRLSLFLILKGLFWGNAIALLVCLLQKHFQIVKLDREMYYMSHVPIEIDPLLWLAVNLGATTLIMLMLLGPSRIVGRISPGRVMHFD
ncbi:hypothetical protein HQ45_00695 [Porphyromonas crevioricanis]|uniref:ABC transporter permease n=1 Tax=Porphyromonas crevioricanis TaxID=393921 RepID=UPI00052B52A7|nr:FtsX-like permease family protein [Porphyromonas crevioricanis]KGN91324.1 hypothetical protein HQ45_00695 [Porphyromonas crevioricanis]